MIEPSKFYQALTSCGVDFFAGVPDSLLKQFCAYISDTCSPSQHVICANEGNAIAMGVGSYLADGNLPLIYMQNSGLGNAVNPLLSLADAEVYGIPMILMIGWRGEPGVKDEPQHVKQGRVQLSLLDAMEIPYQIIDSDTQGYEQIIRDLCDEARNGNRPVAIVIRKDTFAEYKMKKASCNDYSLTREQALKEILEADSSYSIVSTTGKTSRELYELRIGRSEEPRDFLTVGSMGHSSSIAAAIALKMPHRKLMCIDGDGALIMHMGSLAVIGKLAPPNFVHVVINNFCHESVGGQATASESLNMEYLAKAAGYKHYYQAVKADDIKDVIQQMRDKDGPILIEIRVKPGSRSDLGRPKSSTTENKQSFIAHLRS